MAVLGGLLFFNIETALAGEQINLSTLVHRVLGNHPRILAVQSQLKAAQARKKAADQALYNPNFELDYEDASDVTQTLTLSQAIDWSDKRAMRTRVAAFEYDTAIAQLKLVRQELALELLTALASYHAADDLSRIAEQRRDLMRRFLSLSKQRRRAGDLAQVALDLARLANMEARLQLARLRGVQAQAEQGLMNVAEAGPEAWPDLPDIPAVSLIQNSNPETLLEQLPRLRVLRAQVAIARAAVDLRQSERRADPTISLRGGRESSDSLMALTFSMPLFVRNTFSAEVDAARADATQMAQQLRDARRRSRARLIAASRRFEFARQAWEAWLQTGQASLESQVRLLERLWSAGELSTTDYLVQLKQTLDTRSAAAELRGSLWQAWFEWLAASGKTEDWLGLKG